MKKVLSILLVLTLLMGVSSGFVLAEELLPDADDFEVEYLAAPAVAGILLEAAGVDNRYGQGKDGGNYIKEVAAHMGPGTDFDEVVKEDEVEYAKAVARFLRTLPMIPENFGSDLFKAELVSVWYVGTSDTFGTHAGETLTFTFSNDVFLDREFPHVLFSGGVATIGTGGLTWTVEEGNKVIITSSGTFITPRPKVGDIVTGFNYISDEIGNPVTVPAGGVVVQGDYTYDLTGTWDMDLYMNGTLYARFIVIDGQMGEVFSGDMGTFYPVIQGSITGTVDGRSVYMFYDRDDNPDVGYFAEFTGTLAWDGYSASGTWKHGDDKVYRTTDINMTWDMTKR